MNSKSGKLIEPFDCLSIGEEVELTYIKGMWLLNYGLWDDAASIQLSLDDVELLQRIIE